MDWHFILAEIASSIVVAFFAGGLGAITALAIVRTDVSWIKDTLKEHAQDIRDLHGRIDDEIDTQRRLRS